MPHGTAAAAAKNGEKLVKNARNEEVRGEEAKTNIEGGGGKNQEDIDADIK